MNKKGVMSSRKNIYPLVEQPYQFIMELGTRKSIYCQFTSFVVQIWTSLVFFRVFFFLMVKFVFSFFFFFN